MTSKVMNLKMRNLIPDWDVWSAPKLSPMSSSWLKELQNYTEILVVEEHIAHGGLSSLLQNALSKSKTRVSSVSAKSSFHSGIGSYEWALSQNGLDDASILGQIKQAGQKL
jgi:deoxyxylulose-5-phosphate synthase